MYCPDFATALTGLDQSAYAALCDAAPDIEALSLTIQEHPEQAFEEFFAAAELRRFLSQRGFSVASGSPRLPTSFAASYGDGDTTIGIVAEYDALPNGHACGHHIILGAAVAAALALKPCAQELGLRIKVIGAPAEEHGGGKVYLLQDGIFDDVHAALMVHAISGDDHIPSTHTTQAVGRWRARYTGRAAHAAGCPDQGINAADAVVIAQVAVGLLRQQIPDGYRTNMFIREAGVATNIISERAIVDFEVRAPELTAFHELYAKVLRCFEAGALATGCSLDVVQLEPIYEPIRNDARLSHHWATAFAHGGRELKTMPTVQPASTDFGNVSQALPALHPWVAIPGVEHGLHSDGFRDAATSPAALTTMFDAGLALARSVISCLSNTEDVAYLHDQHAQRSPQPRTVIPGQDSIPSAPKPH
ncbi:MAG: amidohydrolase [Propionibacteriaceae bacterium]